MPVVHVEVAELLGSFADNDGLRRIAIKLEDDGDTTQALAILQALNAHIASRPADRKSTLWLLPDVEARVARLTTGVSGVPASPTVVSGDPKSRVTDSRSDKEQLRVSQGMEATVLRWLLRVTFIEHAFKYLSSTIGPLIADVQPVLQDVGPVVKHAIKAFAVALVQIIARGERQ